MHQETKIKGPHQSGNATTCQLHIMCNVEMNIKNSDWADFQLSIHLHYKVEKVKVCRGKRYIGGFHGICLPHTCSGAMQPTHFKPLCRVGYAVKGKFLHPLSSSFCSCFLAALQYTKVSSVLKLHCVVETITAATLVFICSLHVSTGCCR